MVKYIEEETTVVFSEIPDEITLAINITNCPHHCKGCHSPYLRDDIGSELTKDVLEKLIDKNEGITCVLFMGEGKDADALIDLAKHVTAYSLNNKNLLKTGVYCGTFDIDKRFWKTFDYLKLGPYIEECGPLNKETTNQRLYKYDAKFLVYDIENKNISEQYNGNNNGWRDITYMFWKK